MSIRQQKTCVASKPTEPEKARDHLPHISVCTLILEVQERLTSGILLRGLPPLLGRREYELQRWGADGQSTNAGLLRQVAARLKDVLRRARQNLGMAQSVERLHEAQLEGLVRGGALDGHCGASRRQRRPQKR